MLASDWFTRYLRSAASRRREIDEGLSWYEHFAIARAGARATLRRTVDTGADGEAREPASEAVKSEAVDRRDASTRGSEED